MHDKESGTAGNTYKNNKTGLLAVSPMFFFAALFLGISMLTGDFYKVSLSVVFTISSIYAIFTLKNRSISDRIRIFSSGAGQENLMMMLWIFIMAGAFAQTAKDIGAIDAAVNITLSLLPAHLVLVGLFAASCFVSISIGTSVGTTAALVPIASGIAANTGEPVALVVAIVVGGAFFGDNLSLISDTTIAATKTQNCELSDKFKANFQIVLPAAIITLVLRVAQNSPNGAERKVIPFGIFVSVVGQVVGNGANSHSLIGIEVKDHTNNLRLFLFDHQLSLLLFIAPDTVIAQHDAVFNSPFEAKLDTL